MKIVRVGLTILIIIFIGLFIFAKKPKVKIEVKEETVSNITSLHYSYGTGNEMNANVVYDIECEEECTIKMKPNGYDSEDVVTFTTPKDILKEIEEVLNKYDVIEWDGFNKSDPNVLDGNSFSFIVRTKERNITASGYMMYPDNYYRVTDKIENIIEKYDPTVKQELFTLEQYKDLKLEDIKEVVLEENIMFKDPIKTFTEKDKIEYYYNIWKNTIVLNESTTTNEVSRKIKFITNDNKEYIINDGYDLILLNDKWYYYNRK